MIFVETPRLTRRANQQQISIIARASNARAEPARGLFAGSAGFNGR